MSFAPVSSSLVALCFSLLTAFASALVLLQGRFALRFIRSALVHGGRRAWRSWFALFAAVLLLAVPAAAQTSLSVPVGQTSAVQTATVTITTPGSPANFNVLTQGAPNLDFQFAGGGTCTYAEYQATSTCTVNYTFSPKAPGLRLGAVTLTNSNGVLGMAYISGIGTGPQVAFNAPLATTALGSGLGDAYGVAVDAAGNVYVADLGNKAVKEFPANCNSSSCIAILLGGGFASPFGVAVDGAGNVYVTDSHLGLVDDTVEYFSAIKEIPVGCVSSDCVITLVGGFQGADGIGVDGRGNIYTADFSKKAVYEIPLGCAASACVTSLGGSFVAVGTSLTARPPLRSVRAALPHTAPAKGGM